MFEAYVLSEGSIKNVKKDEITSGFEMKTLIPYYRGIPCSMVHLVEVLVDGVQMPEEWIYFSPNGEDFFSLKELKTVSAYKWEYGEEATIYVKSEGGLSKGRHVVMLRLAVRVAYIPVPFVGQRAQEVVIE